MEKSKKIPWPPPASMEAILLKCTCPVEANNNGIGVPSGLGVDYMCSTDCPLHGKLAKEKANETK